jgi:hypothetical protein
VIIIKVVAVEKKKLIELIGSIFVAMIFISSYAAFGVGRITVNTTTTVQQQQTFYAIAQTTANIISYGSTMNINISCQNVMNLSRQVNDLLADLESNNSVSYFYSQQAGQIIVQSGKVDTYANYNSISSYMGVNANCTEFTSSATVMIPNKMNFYAPLQKSSMIILISNNRRDYSVPIKFVNNMSNTLNVSVSALLTLNGSIYGNLSVQKR